MAETNRHLLRAESLLARVSAEARLQPRPLYTRSTRMAPYRRSF
jgi:hypothetical protein